MSMKSDSITDLFPRPPLHQLSTEVSLRASLFRGEEACLSCKVVRQSLANPKSTRATCREDTPFSEGYREDSQAPYLEAFGVRALGLRLLSCSRCIGSLAWLGQSWRTRKSESTLELRASALHDISSVKNRPGKNKGAHCKPESTDVLTPLKRTTEPLRSPISSKQSVRLQDLLANPQC